MTSKEQDSNVYYSLIWFSTETAQHEALNHNMIILGF